MHVEHGQTSRLVAHRVHEALGQLAEAHPLEGPLHVKGLFSDLASGFNRGKFISDLASHRLTPGYGNVSYLVYSSLGSEPPPAPDIFPRTCPLPIPAWIKEFQAHVLGSLYDEGKYGWSAELFWSQEINATLGVHIDNDDVYTIQVLGEKQWRIDAEDLRRLYELLESGQIWREGPWEAWVPQAGIQLSFCGPQTITVVPGDLLVVPAFAMHFVTAVTQGPNLSANASICQEQVWNRYVQSRHVRCRHQNSPGEETKA